MSDLNSNGMSPADLARFAAHINSYPNMEPCPICRQRGWVVLGVQGGNRMDENGVVQIGGPTVPLAMIGCTTCCYVRHFAWMPIKNGVRLG